MNYGNNFAEPLLHPPPLSRGRRERATSKQPKPFGALARTRVLARTHIQQCPQRLAGGVRLRPFGFRHAGFAVPVAGMRREAIAQAPAAGLRAIAPVTEQRALLPGHAPIFVAVAQPAP